MLADFYSSFTLKPRNKFVILHQTLNMLQTVLLTTFLKYLALFWLLLTVKKCMEYKVEGIRPRGRPKKTWREIVEKDCIARGLNTDDAMCRNRWRKQIGMIDDYDECSEWMFLLVPAHPGCPRQFPQSRKTVVCVCMQILYSILECFLMAFKNSLWIFHMCSSKMSSQSRTVAKPWFHSSV